MILQPMTNRLPTGPGSRGGRWHERDYRNDYHRAWRAAHPEYRDREKTRRALTRKRAGQNAADPADTGLPRSFPRPLPSPNAGLACRCSGCNCQNTILVVRCDMCMRGLHEQDHAPTIEP